MKKREKKEPSILSSSQSERGLVIQTKNKVRKERKREEKKEYLCKEEQGCGGVLYYIKQIKLKKEDC